MSDVMKVEAIITIDVRVTGYAEIEANGLITRVLPDCRMDMGPNIGGVFPVAECYRGIQAQAVKALEVEARKLVNGCSHDPLAAPQSR